MEPCRPMKTSETLFSPLNYGRLAASNRFVRSATNDRTATDEGRPTGRTEILFSELARGDIGLIITGHAYVHPSGIAGFDQWGMHRDDLVPAFRRVVDVVHREGSRVVMQLAHAGRKGSAHIPLDGGHPLAADENSWKTLAPSALPFGPDWPVPQALSREGLAAVRAEFVAAAERADRIGFNLVELHSAHGYLLHQFLSPLSNQRNDEFEIGNVKRETRDRLLHCFAASLIC